MKQKLHHFVGVFALALLVLASAPPAMAAAVPNLGKDAAIIVDGVSGRILYERNAFDVRYPASLTKMMTLYLLFEAFEDGSIGFDTMLPTSSFAASQSPTKLNLRPGETIDAKTAMEAIIVQSANDVAVVVAEALGGTEAGFAGMMTQKAGELGMLDSHFANASGLPDAQQISTASDMALLGRRLAYDFPEYYPYLSRTEFTFKGRRVKGHNNLLGVFEGTDGIKTGYTRASGFNLVTSAVRGNKHLVGVVMGGTSAVSRDNEMKRILSIAFEEVEKNPLLVAYANVPWQNGDGPKSMPSWEANVPPPVLLAAFGPQIQSARSAQNGTAIAIAALPSESAVIPREKPVMSTMANAAQPYNGGDMIAALIQGLSTLNQQKLATEAQTAAPSRQASIVLPKPKPILAQGSVAMAETQNVSDATETQLWSIQIGAFTNENTAKAQLEVYAQNATDALRNAERIVVPFSGEGGRTYYRARFGPFAESDARALCQSMMSKGETCFTSEYGPDI